MGQNLYVAKKYEVEYVETSCDFHNKVHAFYELLAALGGEPNAVGSEDGMYSDYFECNVWATRMPCRTSWCISTTRHCSRRATLSRKLSTRQV